MTEVTKSSDEILTELFDSFKTEGQVDVSDGSGTPKSSKEEHSKSKKKHKKDKKHKNDEKDKHRKKKKCKRHKKKNEASNQTDRSSKSKKKKKRKYSSESCDSEDESKNSLKKQNVESSNKENSFPEEKTSCDSTVNKSSANVNSFDITCDTSNIPLPPPTGDITVKVAHEFSEVKKSQVSEVFEKTAENGPKPTKKLFLQGFDKPKMSIKIGNLKNSQVLEAAEEAKIKAERYEEGEITDESNEESLSPVKIKAEALSDNDSNDEKKKLKQYHHQKKCRKRIKDEISPQNFVQNSDENKSSTPDGNPEIKIPDKTLNVNKDLEKDTGIKKNHDNESSTQKDPAVDNKNQLKSKKPRQLRERKVDDSCSDDESPGVLKSSPKHSKGDLKILNNKEKRSDSKVKSTDDRSSSDSSDSESPLTQSRNSKFREVALQLKDNKTSSHSRRNSTSETKSKLRKSRSRDRSSSRSRNSRSKEKRSRSSSRSKIRKSRSRTRKTRSKSRSKRQKSRSGSRHINRKSRSVSKNRRRKSSSRSRERKRRSRSYSKSRVKKSRSHSRSRLRKSKTPSRIRSRKSRSASKQKKSPTPWRLKSKKSRSRSSSRTKSRKSKSRSRCRKSRSPSRSRLRKSGSLSRSRGIKSRSRSRLRSGKSTVRSGSKNKRSRSRSRARSVSRNRSLSNLRHSRSRNRRSRSRINASSMRRSKSRDSRSRSKQSLSKSSRLENKRERSSNKRSDSKSSDSSTDKSHSDLDSKYEGSKSKKSKEKKSHLKKHKSKHKDINSRLLALSSTKIESSSDSEQSTSESDRDNNKTVKKKSHKGKKSIKGRSHSEDRKNKAMKPKNGSSDKNEEGNIDSINITTLDKKVDTVDESDSKPKINLKQKIHYSLADDEPIAMTELEMKILNAKNKKALKTAELNTANSLDNKLKENSKTKTLKLKQETKVMDLAIGTNIVVKPKAVDLMKIDRNEDISKNIKTELMVQKSKVEDNLKKDKMEILLKKSKTGALLETVKGGDIVLNMNAEDSFYFSRPEDVKVEMKPNVASTFGNSHKETDIKDTVLKMKTGDSLLLNAGEGAAQKVETEYLLNRSSLTEEEQIKLKLSNDNVDNCQNAEKIVKKGKTDVSKKSKIDEIKKHKAEETFKKVNSELTIKISEAKDNIKMKNESYLLKEDFPSNEVISARGFPPKSESKDPESENEMGKMDSYDSDGQRSDTAMRKIFFDDRSNTDSSDSEDGNTKHIDQLGEVPQNDSKSSEDSKSDSDDEKTFFGISKDLVQNTDDSRYSKTEPIKKVFIHSSNSNDTSIDKNITDSDDEVSDSKANYLCFKNDSDSIESNISINKRDDFPLEKGKISDNCISENTIADKILNKSSKSTLESKSCTSGKKLPRNDIRHYKETSLTLKDCDSSSTCLTEIENQRKNENITDFSPKKTNTQDFLYEYEKSEMEDEKLDFEEDKSSESDVPYNSKNKEEVAEITEGPVSNNSLSNKNIGVSSDFHSSPYVLRTNPEDHILRECDIVENNDKKYILAENSVLSFNESEQPDEKVLTKEIVSDFSKQEIKDASSYFICDEFSSSDKTSIVKTIAHDVDIDPNTSDIPVPSTEMLGQAVASVGRDLFQKVDMSVKSDSQQNVSDKSCKVFTDCEKTNTLKSDAVEEKTSEKEIKSDLQSDSDILGPLDVSHTIVPMSKLQSISRSRSRSKLSKTNSCVKRSKSRPRKDRSSSRKSISKDRLISRRSKSKDKPSRSRKGRSKSHERRSRSKGRHSKSRERRRRSRDRVSRSVSGRSRSKEKTCRLRDRRSRDRRSKSRRRAVSRSRKRSRSRERRSRSRRRNSRSRDKRSRERRKKSRSCERRSHSRGRRLHSRSRDKRSRSRKPRGRSQTSRDKRSQSRIKKGESDHKSLSRSCSEEKQEPIDNQTSLEELKTSSETVLKNNSTFSKRDQLPDEEKNLLRSESKEKIFCNEKELNAKTSSPEKTPDRSSKEKSNSPSPEVKHLKTISESKKKIRSRSISLEKCGNDSSSNTNKSHSPDSKNKRSRSMSVDKLKSKKKKVKSKSKSKERSQSKEVKTKSKDRKSRSRSREKKSKTDEKHSKSHRKRSRSRSKSKEKTKSRDKRSRSRDRRSKSRDKKSRRSRSRSRRRKSDKKERTRRSRSRSKSRTRKRSKKSRSRSRSKDEFFIDKSKLLEIARKNALSMMKQGAVGTDLNKVTAITAGGKTVDELTDFCKLLSQKDATGQESVSSESSSENESEKPFHHPFQLKERSNNIIMNIRNCVSLPVKTHLEKTTENAQQLRLQFPVSSGQYHRKSENDWIPVSPKKTEDPKAIMPAPIRKLEEEPPMYAGLQETVNFSNIPLPNSVTQSQPPLPTLHQLSTPWPQSNDSGAYTGTSGARFLSQAELSSGHQAWAKKDQLISAQPVIGGMGMSLLQKMGWKPGEGLGRRNEGTLEPLKLQVKMDKRGLLCADELPQPRFKPHVPKNHQPAKSLEGKHPVSLLVEYCTRKHYNPPMFTVLSEEGPAHKKNFVFKVTVNGVDYQPPNPSPNKKQAKSEAAVLCLRALGLLPTV